MAAFDELTDEQIDEMAADVQRDAMLAPKKGKLARREALGKWALQGLDKNNSPGFMAGRVFIPSNIGSALAQGLRGYTVGRMDKRAGELESEIGGVQGQLSGNFLRNMVKAMRAKKAAVPALEQLGGPTEDEVDIIPPKGDAVY